MCYLLRESLKELRVMSQVTESKSLSHTSIKEACSMKLTFSVFLCAVEGIDPHDQLRIQEETHRVKANGRFFF